MILKFVSLQTFSSEVRGLVQVMFHFLLERYSLACESNLRLLWFALQRLVISLKISRHFLTQTEVKPRPVVIGSRTLSRASCRLHAFASRFDWFTGLPVSFVIGQSNYFAFGFTTLN